MTSLGLRMGNGQAYSQLFGMGKVMKNLITNFRGWEWECKLNSQHWEMGNGLSFPKRLGMQLIILKCLFHA